MEFRVLFYYCNVLHCNLESLTHLMWIYSTFQETNNDPPMLSDGYFKQLILRKHTVYPVSSS